ncbi:MAG: hypothetical protein IKS45_08770 [Thermoguttaceae bacterium]|nr:hypothetical protein [Thermoguttaceae bacterium]
MEGGNEATNGSGITHSPEQRTKRWNRAYRNAAAENASGSRTKSAKETRKPPKNTERGKPLRPTGSRLCQPPKKFSRKVRKEIKN